MSTQRVRLTALALAAFAVAGISFAQDAHKPVTPAELNF